MPRVHRVLPHSYSLESDPFEPIPDSLFCFYVCLFFSFFVLILGIGYLRSLEMSHSDLLRLASSSALSSHDVSQIANMIRACVKEYPFLPEQSFQVRTELVESLSHLIRVDRVLPYFKPGLGLSVVYVQRDSLELAEEKK